MTYRTIVAVALSLAAITACGEGGGTGEIKAPPELAVRAKVSGEAAKATALARVPGGKILSGELEEEGGMLVYSFDIKVEGQAGVQEVQVDALNGELVAEEHETAAQEAAEAAGEDTPPKPPVGALVEETPGLMARAKVSDQDARTAALARVPGGRIVGAELEEEDGILIYSYDIAVEGQEGVQEVHVDADTGDVLSVEHEEGGGEEGR
jgi:uncharacterized membrane protein YkoI